MSMKLAGTVYYARIADMRQTQVCSRYSPSGHMTLIQRRLNVDATSWRCIDVEPTLYKRHMPAGSYCFTSRKHAYIVLTPLSHFYIVTLGFIGVYTLFFLFLLKNIDCGSTEAVLTSTHNLYSLEPPRRRGSNEYPQSMFLSRYMKNIRFFLWKLSVFGGEILIDLNRRLFEMTTY